MPTCSLIVTTYNWKEALALCLDSIRVQRRLPDEVIIADDGSRQDTGALIAAQAADFPVPLRHVWQEDIGFRAARVRNLAIAASACDYIVMIDGDMVLHPAFIADHLASAQPGAYLQGNRLNASQGETGRLLAGGTARFAPWMPGSYKRRHAVRMPWLGAFKARYQQHGAVMSCNMSMWRRDLQMINGFDESYEGWGREDNDLALRLGNAGVVRRPLRFAGLAVHLWHRTRVPDGLSAADELPNDRFLQHALVTRAVRCARGLDTHLSPSAVEAT